MNWVCAIVTVLLSACSGMNPTAPSATVERAFNYPPELAPVIRALDAELWIHPLLGERPGSYVRTHVQQIKFDSTVRPPFLAWAYPGGTVGWQTYNPLSTYDTPDVALSVAYLLHEARHQQGHWHTCGNNDRTMEEGGAWAVHILYLEHAGYQKVADAVRAAQIGCQ